METSQRKQARGGQDCWMGILLASIAILLAKTVGPASVFTASINMEHILSGLDILLR